MNLKKLTTLLFAGVTAATPFATNAQNPTILQGNYISNVFGQANFVLNPNAQTNVANVTLTNATATRSTTTPLVATSEWNVTVTSANGTAAWATRSFDAGMKNQNCEARFSYRGFQATSKAQIKQGANVVAELTLTPSATDPRIASINFPCGDLSAATTFVITDTATLGGVNKIGGIYVGLATNQANVAQAEEVGSYEVAGVSGCNWARSGPGSNAFGNFPANSNCGTGVVTGAADTSQGKIPGARFNNLKPGKYMFIADYTLYKAGTVSANVRSRLSDGTNYSNSLLHIIPATQDTAAPATSVLTVEYTTTTSPVIQLQGWTNDTTNQVLIFNGEATPKFKLVAYRFPLSSELVVTPETQNVWGSKKFTSAGSSIILFSGAAPSGTITTFNSSAITQANAGKCENTTTANDIGCKITAMPTGSFKVTFDGFLRTYTPGAGGDTNCVYDIYETTTASIVATHSSVASGQANANYAEGKNITGVFNNTSLADRNFVIRAKKQGGATNGYCQFYTDPSDIGQMIIQPLDNASNSALYVQGPVKAAATGTAIPAGYVGEVIQSTQTGTTALSTSNTYYTSEPVTLTPGVWSCFGNHKLYYGGTAPAGFTRFQAGICAGASCTPANENIQTSPGANAWGTTDGVNFGQTVFSQSFFNVTTSTTYYLSMLTKYTALNNMVIDNNGAVLKCVRIN